MERKERNAEGKTSACQIPSFISAINIIEHVYVAHTCSIGSHSSRCQILLRVESDIVIPS